MRFKDQNEFDEFERRRKLNIADKPVKAPEPEIIKEELQGYRSKLELSFATLLGHCKRAGRIKSWMYEPMRLKLHKKSVLKNGKERISNVYYTPDFMVVHNDGSIEIIETKGYLRKAAELKYYEAVEKFSCFSWRMVKQEKGVWVNMHIKGEDRLF